MLCPIPKRLCRSCTRANRETGPVLAGSGTSLDLGHRHGTRGSQYDRVLASELGTPQGFGRIRRRSLPQSFSAAQPARSCTRAICRRIRRPLFQKWCLLLRRRQRAHSRRKRPHQTDFRSNALYRRRNDTLWSYRSPRQQYHHHRTRNPFGSQTPACRKPVRERKYLDRRSQQQRIEQLLGIQNQWHYDRRHAQLVSAHLQHRRCNDRQHQHDSLDT